MRLWSLHPKYLDSSGLGGLWREGLGAMSVIGTNKGYSKHPQLTRFTPKILFRYMSFIYEHSLHRQFNYNIECLHNKVMNNNIFEFNKNDIENIIKENSKIFVNDGQVIYEAHHLLSKLLYRNKPEKYINLLNDVCRGTIEIHPIFKIKEGYVEEWEKNK